MDCTHAADDLFGPQDVETSTSLYFSSRRSCKPHHPLSAISPAQNMVSSEADTEDRSL